VDARAFRGGGPSSDGTRLTIAPRAGACTRLVRLRPHPRLTTRRFDLARDRVFTTDFGGPRDPRSRFEGYGPPQRNRPAAHRGHTLPDLAAGVMLADGVPLKVVSEILCHSSMALTDGI
jgi:hypothetical protein